MASSPLIGVTALLTLLALGCGPIESEPRRDEEGEIIAVPDPYDDWLRVAEVSPPGGEVGPRPTLRLRFETWIEDDALVDFRVVTLASAGLTTGGRVAWTMTTRTLEFTPFSDLVPGLKYSVQIDGAGLESVTGAPYQSRQLPTFVVVADGEEFEPEPEPSVAWSDVDELLDRKCRSCHADPEWQLNPLTHESLVGGRSEQSDAILVIPFDAADSYLMHKILPDYPVRRFTVQPPPWSTAARLTEGEIFLVERWIANGARR